MAKSGWQSLACIWIIILVVSFVGCGKDELGGDESKPTKMLTWNPPTTYADGSPLNPAEDLDSYEIYIKESSNFADTDDEMAALSAFEKATGQVCTSFDLANLAPFISKGVTYHISIRAVSKNGLKSDFSPTATFSY